MSQPEEHDVVVLGSGEAGKYLAWHLAAQGQRTVVVERRYVGGSCPNVACLPSKNVIHGAKVASYFRRGEEFGVTAPGWQVDMARVRERKRRMVAGLVEMHLGRFKASGAELAMGQGRFVGPRTIEVTPPEGDAVRTLRGRRVIICTGSRTPVEAVPGLRESRPLTHVEALDLDRVPEHLVVLGGGYIGLELAQALRRLGSRVTIVERHDQLASREDVDVSDALQDLCRDEGIEVVLGAAVTRVEGTSGETVTLRAVQQGTEIVLRGTHLLVAGGRTPNTAGIGLDRAGVEITDGGFVRVNERLETTAPDTWAVGDCAGSPHFTHVAFDDYRVVRDNLAGGSRVVSGRQVPYCLFTDPEFARVGLNEREAQERGIGYRLAKLPAAAILRTWTISEPRGFLKALVAADSDRLLGFAAFGAEAGGLLVGPQVVMSAGLPYTALRDAVLTHPTMAEGFNALFASVPARTKA